MTSESAKEVAPRALNGSGAAAAILYCKGIAMGLGDSVPGVSGGTIAVITRIYDELIFSIRSVDEQALGLVLKGQIAAAWKHINGNFLLTLALGILSGLLVSANTVLYLLENRFEALMGFFVGLVMASTVLLFGQFNVARPANVGALLLGCLVTTSVGVLEPAVSELSLVYLFFCGLIAISAMILPGLSGAFILLLLGAYEHMLEALTGLQWSVIAVFISGCIVGIIAFSRLLALALRRFRDLSYGFITGLLLGSLSVLWPWQRPISYYTDSDGIEQVLQTARVWPLNYTEQTGLEPQFALVIACMIFGLLAVFLLDKIFASRST